MKTNAQTTKPWEDENGVPYSTEALKTISKSWDRGTWKRYLDSLTVAGTERLISPTAYSSLAEKQTRNCFDEGTDFFRHPKGIPPEMKSQVLSVLGKLRPRQKWVIHGLFWEQKSLAQVARELKVSEQRVDQLGRSALAEIKRLLSATSQPSTNSGGRK